MQSGSCSTSVRYRRSAETKRSSARLRASMSCACATKWSGVPSAPRTSVTLSMHPDLAPVGADVALLHLVRVELAGERAPHVVEVEREVVGVRDLLERRARSSSRRRSRRSSQNARLISRKRPSGATSAMPIDADSNEPRNRRSLSSSASLVAVLLGHVADDPEHAGRACRSSRSASTRSRPGCVCRLGAAGRTP